MVIKMPTYTYKCKNCDEIFEIFQRITDEPITRCKKCSGEVDKIITSGNFVLKGKGWFNSGGY
jgi:putative FmdB family regulatory protein